MQNRTLGKTGETVSILGFGCMRLPLLDPSDPSSIDLDLATNMVRKAIDRGVNYLDTAYPYHRSGDLATPGASEPFLAHALKDGYREKVKIATKLPTWFMEDKAQMNRILDEQLKRLNVSQIDFYLAHNMNRPVWPKMRDIGMFEFLSDAMKDGRIKHVGFSFHDHYDLFEEILGAFDWSFAQIQYNYLDIDFQAGRKGLDLAAKRGLGVVVMEPLRGGFLIQHLPEEMKSLLAKVRPDWSLADWGLRWVWNHPAVGVVLSGMTEMRHVDENLDIADSFEPLKPAEEEALDQVRDYFLKRIKVNCTGCGYCLPCPTGVNIPKVFALYNDYYAVDSSPNHTRVESAYRMQVKDAEAASNCVSCGACESKCPQNLPISREMPEAAGIFG